MKKVLRSNVFETASSAVCNLVILSEEDDKKWQSGGYVYTGYGWEWRDLGEQPKKNKWYSEDEVKDWLCKLDNYNPDDYDSEDYWFRDYDFISSDIFFESEYLETDSETYITPGGEKIVVNMQYGRDG